MLSLTLSVFSWLLHFKPLSKLHKRWDIALYLLFLKKKMYILYINYFSINSISNKHIFLSIFEKYLSLITEVTPYVSICLCIAGYIQKGFIKGMLTSLPCLYRVKYIELITSMLINIYCPGFCFIYTKMWLYVVFSSTVSVLIEIFGFEHSL